jgi:hypothetical protein
MADVALAPTRDTSGNTVHTMDLASHVTQLFRQARQHRKPLITQWTKNYHILRNKTWGTRKEWLPTPEVPEIYPIIAAITAWQTDTDPTFDAIPHALPNTDQYNKVAQLTTDLQQVLQAVWMSEHFSAEGEKILWDANVYGIGVGKVTWDTSLQGGRGNPAFKRVDPYTFYPDPDATNLDDAQYLIEARIISTQELEKRFPGSRRKVGEGGSAIDADEAPNKLREGTRPTLPRANPGALPNTDVEGKGGSGTPNMRYGLPGQGSHGIAATDEAGHLLIEAWLRTPVEVEGSRSDTWRVVAVVGNTVLMDEPALNLWDHGQHPYGRYVPHDTGEFYGVSLVELLTPSQLSINRLLASVEQNIWLTGNPVFVADTASGVARQTVTNRPGQRLDVNRGTDSVKWMQPPQSNPQQTTSLIDFYIGEMDRISGLSAIVRGVVPTGRNAQGTIDSLAESAFVRIRMNLRNYERFLSHMGELCASHIAEFYDAPRYVPVLGEDKAPETAMALQNQHFYMETTEGIEPLRSTIRVRAGSLLPTSKQARAQEAQSLYALGAIDEEALLDAMDWPGRHNTIARVREMKAADGTLGQPPTQRAAARR